MKFKNVIVASLVALPFTVLDVTAADNTTDKLKSVIVDKSVQKFENSFNSKFQNTELSIEAKESSDANFSLFTVQPIHESEDKKGLTFFQGSLINKNDRNTINLGIGYRNLSDNEKWIYGINAFHDYDFDYEHSRMSIGAEIRSSSFEVNLNKYYAISNAQTGKGGNTERALDGQEIEIGGQIPYIPSAKIFIKDWKWEGYQTADTEGKTYSLQINSLIAPNVTLEAGTKSFDNSTDVDFINLSYKIGLGGEDSQKDVKIKDLVTKQAFSNTSMKKKMLDKVRRKNQIVIQSNFSSAAGGV